MQVTLYSYTLNCTVKGEISGKWFHTESGEQFKIYSNQENILEIEHYGIVIIRE